MLLRTRFSISTAEEFVSAVARSGEALKKELVVENSVWEAAIKSAQIALPNEIRKALETPSPTRFGKGAVLASGASAELRKYLSR